MKRILAVSVVALSVLASVPSHAAPRCQAPVSTDCTTKDEDGNDTFCNVYVFAETPTGGSSSACIEIDD